MTATMATLQSYKEQATKLAGQIAFLKMYSTRCAQDTARDAVQIFGGRGITQTGMGRFIEHASHLAAACIPADRRFSSSSTTGRSRLTLFSGEVRLSTLFPILRSRLLTEVSLSGGRAGRSWRPPSHTLYAQERTSLALGI
jgi:hypothetical protein